MEDIYKTTVWLVQTEWCFPNESGHSINCICSTEDVAYEQMDALHIDEIHDADSGNYPESFGEYEEEWEECSWTIRSTKYPDLYVTIWIKEFDVIGD